MSRQLLRTWRSANVSLIVFAAGVAAWLTSRLLPLLPIHAELEYGSGIGALLSRPLSLITGAVPFSVAEVGLIAYGAWLVVLAARAIDDAAHARRRPSSLLAGGTMRMLRHAGAYVALFYLLWGMNYARPAFARQAGWPPLPVVNQDELHVLAEATTLAANRAYFELHGSDDIGTPTSLAQDIRDLDASLDAGWQRAASLLQLPPAATRRYGAIKQPFVSPVIARLGLAGMYVPFTGEATIVHGMPAIRTPMSMAHEKAHQRGIARESDANFLAFVAASSAADPLSRYAAALFAQQQLYAELTRFATVHELQRIHGLRAPGVQRDLQDAFDYYMRMAGRPSQIGSGINDMFLNANGIEGGVQDYSRSVFLLIGWARRNGGSLLPPSETGHLSDG